jgi:hypothetical protein
MGATHPASRGQQSRQTGHVADVAPTLSMQERRVRHPDAHNMPRGMGRAGAASCTLSMPEQARRMPPNSIRVTRAESTASGTYSPLADGSSLPLAFAHSSLSSRIGSTTFGSGHLFGD